MTNFTTRFAPSPTGPLHLGHAYAALVAETLAGPRGRFLLRIEDIDQSRARTAWETQITEDLRWLGLTWTTPIRRQSEQLPIYSQALLNLWNLGVLYPCSCRRRDIVASLGAPQEGAPTHGPDGVIYPGTCRPDRPPQGPMPTGVALRLNVARAVKTLGQEVLEFLETGAGPDGECGAIRIDTTTLAARIGDVVLARADMGTSYHLSVTVDDAAQNVTLVTRGQDLYDATQIHLLLQRLLAFPTPQYHHHTLVRDDAGKRLAKRDDARAIATYREAGLSVAAVRALLPPIPQAL